MTEFGAGKKKNDIGFLNFDLQTDVAPLFNWNVKQLFLYITAEYETELNVIFHIHLFCLIILKNSTLIIAS
jgi:signal peptidase complex subunit 3